MATNKKRETKKRDRNVSVRAVRRSEPDVRRLGRALIEYALKEAAAEAAAEAEAKQCQQSEQPHD